MEISQYRTAIFPKGITGAIADEHLRVYSKTLISYIFDIQKFVPNEYHKFIPHGLYVCPLCLSNHFIKIDSGIVGNSEFSLDHLPPSSVGGIHKIITCKKCNNDSGAFEGELEKILNFGVDKTKANEGAKIKVQIVDKKTGQTVPALAINKNGLTDIKFHENLKKYSETHTDFFNRLHSNKAKDLTIKVPLFDNAKIGRALLKSAYCLCFVWWGYEFAYSENGAFIREVIKGKKDYPCNTPLNWLEKDNIRSTGISLMQDGEKRMGFLIYLRLKGIEVDTTATVLIPGPDADGLEKISIVNEINRGSQRMEFTCVTLPKIVDRIGYTISWNIVIPKNNKPDQET